MKSISIWIVVLSLVAILAPSIANAQSPFCLPTCEIDDGRFLAISEGNFETFTPGVMNIQIIVPPGTTDFSYGIFDGDSPGASPTGHWDLGIASDFSYVLFIDPDLDNTGPIASQTMATSLPSNDWMDFTVNTDPSALDGNGNFVYTLQITLLDNVDTLNLFKVRSSELLSLDEQFGIVANFASDEDGVTIYPDLNTADGVQPSDYAVTTYDGNFCMNFMLPDPLPELEIWDADLDHGNGDGTDPDTDDPNSPNSVPSFVLPGSDALNEGANDSDPDDDRLVAGPGDFNNFFVRSPAVRYTLTFPDGRMFENINPSGNREWERFVISSIETDLNLVDHTTGSPAPAGRYELCLTGLDMANLSAFRLPLPYIPSFVPPPEPGCCVASQGVCSIDLETACSVPPNLSFLGEGTMCTGEPLCDPPPEPGCCVASQGVCSVDLESACSVPPNLSFLGEGTTCTGESLCDPPPEPGCCVASQGVCSIGLESACPVPPNFQFLGEGSSCTGQALCIPPPEPGCCVASQGVCSLELESACAVPPNFQFLGEGSSCTAQPLCTPPPTDPPPTDPPPTPAPSGCCVASQGVCSIESQSACAVPPNLQFLGEGTSCTAQALCEPTPEPGCCVESPGVCSLTLQTECFIPPNTEFLGAGTSCTGQTQCGAPQPTDPPPTPLPTPGPTDPPPTPMPGMGCCVESQGACSLQLEEGCSSEFQFLGEGTTCTDQAVCALPVDVPSISEFGLIIMAGFLGLLGFIAIHRVKASPRV